MVEPVMDTWWLWIAAGIVIAIMEVAFRGFWFLGMSLGAIATGALIWSGIGPAAWMEAQTLNAVIAFAVLSAIAFGLLRLAFGAGRPPD